MRIQKITQNTATPMMYPGSEVLELVAVAMSLKLVDDVELPVNVDDVIDVVVVVNVVVVEVCSSQ